MIIQTNVRSGGGSFKNFLIYIKGLFGCNGRKSIKHIFFLFVVFCILFSSICGSAYALTRPSKPVVRITQLEYNKVKLSWNKVKKAKGYEVYKYNSKSKKYIFVARIKYTGLITSKNVELGKRNYYKVRAYKTIKGKRVYSLFRKVSIVPRLSVPTINRVSKYNNKEVLISWGKVKGASGYNVYKENSNNKYEYIGSSNITMLVSGYKLSDSNVTSYKVRAYRIVGGKKIYSNYSKEYGFVVGYYFDINSLKPKLVLKGDNPLVVKFNTKYVDPGYSAFDSDGNDISSNVKINNGVNTSRKGKFYIKYVVSDKYKNETSVTRTVIVTDILVNKIELVSDSINVDTNGKGNVEVKSILPSNVSYKKVSYYSSDENIAVVDSSGNVLGKKEGVAVITVMASDGSGVKAECRVTVKDVKVTGISLSDSSASIVVGNSKQLSVKEIKPSNATNKSVRWSSSDTSIVSVDQSGLIKGVKEGEATISVISNDGSNIKTSIKVVVSKIAVTGVKLDHTKAITEVGDKTTIKATVSPSNATYKSVKWSSSNTSIATVSSSGVVTGKGQGKATLKAVADGKSVSIPIYVTKAGDKLYAIDVEDYENMSGSGDCLVFQSKDSSGKKIYGLIDTGPNMHASRVISHFKDIGINQFEFVLITHFHSDHYGGLSKIYSSGIKIKNVYVKKYNGLDSNFKNSIYNSVDEYRAAHVKSWNNRVNLITKNSTIKYVSGSANNSMTLGNFKYKLYNTGQVFSSFDAKCKSTAACNENTNSIIALTTVNGKTLYLNGDLENYNSSVGTTNNQKNYVYYWANKIMTDNKLSSISVVKAAHHGVVGNNPQDALTRLKGQYALITEFKDYVVQKKATTISRLKTSGVPDKNIYYSGNGTVVFNIGSDKAISVLQYAGEGCNKVNGCS